MWGQIPEAATKEQIIVALDDSINPKSGQKIFGCGHFHDHALRISLEHPIIGFTVARILLTLMSQMKREKSGPGAGLSVLAAVRICRWYWRMFLPDGLFSLG
jgi:hypothetical protein